MKAQDIIKKCREELSDFIIYEAKKIADINRWEYDLEEEDLIIETREINNPIIPINIYVSSADCEEYWEEKHQITYIGIEVGGFYVGVDNDNEYANWDIETDTMVKIANALENYYQKIVGKE